MTRNIWEINEVSVRLAQDYDEDRWNAFVEKFSGYPGYLYQWKEILERVYGYECKYLMAEDQQCLVGVFPVALIRSKLFGVHFVSLPFLDYGGPIFASDKIDSSVLNSFLNYLHPIIKEANYFEVRNPMQSEVVAWSEATLQLGSVKYVTFIVNIKGSFNEVWQHRFDKRLRNSIRKAIKKGINVAVGDFQESLCDFYNTYLLTTKNLGSPPHRIEFFSVCSDLLGEKRVKLFLATMSSKVVGGIVAFLSNDTIHPAFIGIEPKYQHLNPTSLLLSRMIEWGCESNYHFLDLGRTLYDSGSYRFKKQWPSEERFQPYYYLGKKIPTQDPREKYGYLSELWSKIPIPLAKRIGPYIKAGIGH